MKKKTATVKKKKQPKCDELLFELEGKVFIVEKNKGKETNRTELEGKTVLGCLVKCITDGVTLMEKDFNKGASNVKRSKMA